MDILLFRAKMICSSAVALSNEYNFIRNYLFENNFPLKLLEGRINNFKQNLDIIKPVFHTAEKEMKIPIICQFQGEASKELSAKLRSSLDRYYPHLYFRLIFVNNHRIKSFFPSRPRGPIGMTSGAIYLYSCGGCSSQYVGKTIRHLSTRMSEHKGVSVRTGKALAVPPHSEIRAHVKKRECAIREENFKILERSKWDRNLLILESILIKSLKPDLNKQEGTYLHVF